MSTKLTRIAGVTLAVACVAVPGAALAGGKKDRENGRMTGGGNAVGVADGSTVKVTHGFTLRCRTNDRPQRLQVNWSGGGKFHLEDLTFSECRDTGRDEGQPRAGFDTYIGEGEGRNGMTAAWKFTDEGEPGRDDEFRLRVWDADGNLILEVDDDLSNGGNHQAHRVTGRAAR